jgi:hypothetical protein
MIAADFLVPLVLGWIRDLVALIGPSSATQFKGPRRIRTSTWPRKLPYNVKEPLQKPSGQ